MILEEIKIDINKLEKRINTQKVKTLKEQIFGKKKNCNQT